MRARKVETGGEWDKTISMQLPCHYSTATSPFLPFLPLTRWRLLANAGACMHACLVCVCVLYMCGIKAGNTPPQTVQSKRKTKTMYAAYSKQRSAARVQ